MPKRVDEPRKSSLKLSGVGSGKLRITGTRSGNGKTGRLSTGGLSLKLFPGSKPLKMPNGSLTDRVNGSLTFNGQSVSFSIGHSLTERHAYLVCQLMKHGGFSPGCSRK